MTDYSDVTEPILAKISAAQANQDQANARIATLTKEIEALGQIAEGAAQSIAKFRKAYDAIQAIAADEDTPEPEPEPEPVEETPVDDDTVDEPSAEDAPENEEETTND